MTWLEIILLAVLAVVMFPVWFPLVVVAGTLVLSVAVYIGAMAGLAVLAVVGICLLPFAWTAQVLGLYGPKRRRRK